MPPAMVALYTNEKTFLQQAKSFREYIRDIGNSNIQWPTSTEDQNKWTLQRLKHTR